MNLIITSGSLVAEIQNNPLNRIQKLLATISRKSELDIHALREHINNIEEMKERRIDKLYDELRERNKLEDLEIEELKTLIMSVAKDNESLPNVSQDFEDLEDRLKSVELSNKSVISKINEKIDRISKDKAARIKSLQEEITRITNDDKRKIATLKTQIGEINIARERARKVLDAKVGGLDVKKEIPKKPGEKDGTKYMGHLNWKPKLPI